MSELTAARLRELFRYDEGAGHFIRLVATNRNAPAGAIAGSFNKAGYRKMQVDSRTYQVHRLAFLYMTGEWPDRDVDHINGDPADNRWGNLRLATRHENRCNIHRARSNNKSGLIGVKRAETPGKWRADIKVDGSYRYLGTYETAEEAHQSYLRAKRQFHSFCTI
jgi:hypothetical protein